MTSRNAIGKYHLLKRAVLYYDGSFLENEFEFNVILWIYPRPSNSGKWRFIGIRYWKRKNPGGNCYCEGGVDPSVSDTFLPISKNRSQ